MKDSGRLAGVAGLVGACACLLGTGCERAQPAASETMRWMGRGGGFGQWGCGGPYLYAGSSDPRILEAWEWNGGTLQRAGELSLGDDSLNPAVATAGWCIRTWFDTKGQQPAEIRASNLKDLTTSRSWVLPLGWDCILAQPSGDGTCVAVVLLEGFESPGWDWERRGVKLGLAGEDPPEIRWVATLTSTDPPLAGNIRTALPSDDGVLIAIAPWNYGVAVVDTKTGQKLWERMPGSNAVQYAAFSPDAKTVYAGGTEGIVYAMDTLTGNVIGKWYASESGREEPGHRIECLAVSPDGRWVAAGTGPEGLVFVGSTATNKMVKTLRHGGSTVLLVHFSPDSSALASFVPGTLKIWKVSQWDDKKP